MFRPKSEPTSTVDTSLVGQTDLQVLLAVAVAGSLGNTTTMTMAAGVRPADEQQNLS
ncbi:MAG: hypothetical protein WD648_11740 [Planctomycetaceae bacterium]